MSQVPTWGRATPRSSVSGHPAPAPIAGEPASSIWVLPSPPWAPRGPSRGLVLGLSVPGARPQLVPSSMLLPREVTVVVEQLGPVAAELAARIVSLMLNPAPPLRTPPPRPLVELPAIVALAIAGAAPPLRRSAPPPDPDPLPTGLAELFDRVLLVMEAVGSPFELS